MIQAPDRIAENYDFLVNLLIPLQLFVMHLGFLTLFAGHTWNCAHGGKDESSSHFQSRWSSGMQVFRCFYYLWKFIKVGNLVEYVGSKIIRGWRFLIFCEFT